MCGGLLWGGPDCRVPSRQCGGVYQTKVYRLYIQRVLSNLYQIAVRIFVTLVADKLCVWFDSLLNDHF